MNNNLSGDCLIKIIKDIKEEAEISQTVAQEFNSEPVSNSTVMFANSFATYCVHHGMLLPKMVYNNENHIGFIFKNKFGIVEIEVYNDYKQNQNHIICKTSYNKHKNYTVNRNVGTPVFNHGYLVFTFPSDIYVHLIDIDFNESTVKINDSIKMLKNELSRINEYFYEFEECINDKVSEEMNDIWNTIDELQLYKIELQNKVNKNSNNDPYMVTANLNGLVINDERNKQKL